ncbi:MAG: trypsin-like serine protease, partial [Planctomycetota bacterium]
MRKIILLILMSTLFLGQQCVPTPQDLPSDAGTPEATPIPSGSEAPQPQHASWQVIWYSDVNGGVASAFAIDTYLMATNAHVVGPVAVALGRPNGIAGLVQHETGEEAGIVNVWIHPEYNGNSATTPDVGIIEVDKPLTNIMPIATQDELNQLAVFDDIMMCG